jgi:hypothetical protein
MSLAVPLALAWAVLAVPIVIFYILKIRLRQVPVSTTIFWQQIYDEKRPRSIWQMLRHLVSLLVQILLLMLLVFALAEPFFTWEILRARRLILVVDNSASMNATDVRPTRLHAAKELGRPLISGLRFRDEMAIIAAGTRPQVVCGLTGHERTLQLALAGIQPSDGPTQVAAAVALGKRLLSDAEHGRVIVLSDGGFEGSEKLADDKLVELRTVGTRAGNLAITNFQVRRSLTDPIGYEILTEVTNASDDKAEARLEIDLGESPVDVIPLSLAAGETWTKAIEKTSIDGGRLIARLDRPDALAADNRAVALLPKRQEQRVVLVTKGNLFLRTALAVNSLVNLQVVAAPPETTEPDVLYVFHREVPAVLPPANCLVIDPLTGTDLWTVGEKLENPIVTKQDADSPLMRHVRLDNVLLPEARQIRPPAGHVPLATALSGEPLYFAHERGDRKLLLLSVNLDQGDLTFRTAFPIMVTNALGWFAGQSGELRESLATGAVTEVALPLATGDHGGLLVLKSPSGQPRLLPRGTSKASLGPLSECGVWSLEPASGDLAHRATDASRSPILELACNLANRIESDLRPPQKLLEAQPTPSLAGGWFTRPIWFYLVALAWLVAATEWFLYQRRWIT